MSSTLALPAADFVICGGGTAGLVLAARLSEIPTVNVAVIEAGGDHSHDVNVLSPGLLTFLYGNPKYDWIYNTSPQVHMNDTIINYPRGKGLGGSSAINYLAWTHASPRNIDNWGLLGNPGWSWDELEPYYRKSENFSIPNATIVSDLDLHWLNDSMHGRSGPIDTAYPHTWSPLDKAWPRTYDNLGLGMMHDSSDGLALGGYDITTNLDRKDSTRSYAATGYLNPIKHIRKNLKVYTHSSVTKVNFRETEDRPAACSVELERDGKKFSIEAGREVILSGGAFGSPQLLELSGIGDEKLLKCLGIETVYDNSYVGENLQDHLLLNIGWPILSDIFSTDNLSDHKTFDEALHQYKTSHTGPLSEVALGGGYLSAQQILPNKNELTAFLGHINHSVNDGKYKDSRFSRQYELIVNDLYEGQEITQHLNIVGSVNNLNASAFPPPTSHGFTIQVCNEHMFSRGFVHIESANASIYPTVNPNFFSHPLDAYTFSRMALQAQNVIGQTPPLSNYLRDNGQTLQPSYTKLTKQDAEAVIRRQAQTVDHPCGTCAMLPEKDGGVVDERLRVYGVKGLRVVDASIFPLIPRGNLQTCVYAVAERAADFIKEDHELS